MYSPIHLKKYFIYDVNYTDCDKYLIVTPTCNNYTISICINNIWHSFKRIQSDNKHIAGSNDQSLYLSDVLSFNDNVLLNINGDLVSTKVNKYIVDCSDQIIMSTIVLNEDKYIRQWINYHMMFSITKFIIYDNYNHNLSDIDQQKHLKKCNNASFNITSNLHDLLSDFIDAGIVILIKWDYSYYPRAQQTHQNHSIYSFQKSKYIGFFDVDEYLNIQLVNNKLVNDKLINDKLKLENNHSFINLHNFFDYIIKENNLNYDLIGSFRLLSQPMFLDKEKILSNDVDIDPYGFLLNYSCGKIYKQSYEKNFVIPSNVRIFSVHMIIDGKPMITIDTSLMFFNHYFYLNKISRGIFIKGDTNILFDDSINIYYILITNTYNNNQNNNIISESEKMYKLFMTPQGGFGNMLFIYLMGYSIAKQYNLDLRFLSLPSMHRPNMQSYDIFKHCIYENNKKPYKSISESKFTYNDIIIPSNTNIAMNGYFQSWKYSSEYINEIKHDLYSHIPEQLQKITQYYNNIKNEKPTIMIHVRRGDYLSLSHFHSNLSDTYYSNSIQEILNKLLLFPNNVKLIVFSDDIEFISKWDIIKSFEYHIVTLTDPVDTFLLMSMCDHFIIANSSLSLSSYLFRNSDNAYLCIPYRWFEAVGPKYLHSDLVNTYLYQHYISIIKE